MPRLQQLKFSLVSLVVVGITSLFATPALAKPNQHAKSRVHQEESNGEKTHTIAAGQTLRSIAKRYQVTIEELREANELKPGAKLAIGQKIVVPVHDKKASKKERDAEDTKPAKKKGRAVEEDERDQDDDEEEEVKPHKKGKAKKAASSDDDDRDVKPSKKSKGKATKKASSDDDEDEEEVKPNKKGKDTKGSKKNDKDKKKKGKDKGKDGDRERDDSASLRTTGTLRLAHFGEIWEGKVKNKHGKVTENASHHVSKMLRFSPSGKQHTIEDRLIALLGQVSDHFGGRTIDVVSGFRPYNPNQYTAHSKHNLGAAVDFRVRGVSNEELRDFCKSFRNVGVGYYPNSSFVHLDVRGHSTTWVDYSRPGERPRYNSPDQGRDADETPSDIELPGVETDAQGGSSPSGGSNSPQPGHDASHSDSTKNQNSAGKTTL